MKKGKRHIGYKTILKTANLLLVVSLTAGVYYRMTGHSFTVGKEPAENVQTAGEGERKEAAPEKQKKNAVKKKLDGNSNPSYMVYYGALDEEIIELAKCYDVVIIHPKGGNITRDQVAEIQEAGVCVLGYLSIGEDLRTAGLTPEQMRSDGRFTGDKTGPRVDAREPDAKGLDSAKLLGKESPGGGGFASYYLDDNDFDGVPDFNPNFGCAYTNIGDPAWYEVLEDMRFDGIDNTPGIREILTESYGRGLGCDGLFLDTVDTCAPNIYTADDDPSRTRFEWTAPGMLEFAKHLKEDYPDKYVLQNRGLFFYNYALPHFDYMPGEYIDFLLFESFMLDSAGGYLYHEGYFHDNKNVYTPKIIAEANRPGGFRVLSLGYAEGPEEYRLKETLLGSSTVGLDILLEDMRQAEDNSGYSHYITDGAVLMVNDFVLSHREEDLEPPAWSTVHNNVIEQTPVPRIGIGSAEETKDGVLVSWDVAIDKSGVTYTLYYQKEPFDFEADSDLEGAMQLKLVPERGEGYGYQATEDTWPYQAVITDLDAGETYYFVIRAKDHAPAENEEKNRVVLSCTAGGTP